MPLCRSAGNILSDCVKGVDFGHCTFPHRQQRSLCFPCAGVEAKGFTSAAVVSETPPVPGGVNMFPNRVNRCMHGRILAPNTHHCTLAVLMFIVRPFCNGSLQSSVYSLSLLPLAPLKLSARGIGSSFATSAGACAAGVAFTCSASFRLLEPL